MNSRKNIEEFENDGDDFSFLKPSSDRIVQVISYESRLISINIDEEVGTPDKYRSVFDILRKATPFDSVNVIVNTHGGCLDTAMQIYHYLLETQANTKAEIHNAYSAGAIIAMACDEIEVARYGSMMIHSIMVSSFGKMHEMDQQVHFSKNQSTTILETVFTNFLTSKELNSIIKGKDVWLSEDDINKRLEKWTPVRKREQENIV